jgi:hypothetical protein
VGCRDNVEPVDEGSPADVVGLVIDFVSDQNDERKFSGLCDLAPDDVLVRVTRATFTYSCLFMLSDLKRGGQLHESRLALLCLNSLFTNYRFYGVGKTLENATYSYFVTLYCSILWTS